MGLPYEHGLHSTLLAMRLAERLEVDTETAFQTYYGCLLFYVGCTVDAEMSAELFDDGVLLRHFNPVMFGTPAQTLAGIMRALADSAGSAPVRAMRAATRLPKAVRGHQRHVAALCEVAQMLSDRLGLPPTVRDLFAHLTDRTAAAPAGSFAHASTPAMRRPPVPRTAHPHRTEHRTGAGSAVRYPTRSPIRSPSRSRKLIRSRNPTRCPRQIRSPTPIRNLTRRRSRSPTRSRSRGPHLRRRRRIR